MTHYYLIDYRLRFIVLIVFQFSVLVTFFSSIIFHQYKALRALKLIVPLRIFSKSMLNRPKLLYRPISAEHRIYRVGAVPTPHQIVLNLNHCIESSRSRPDAYLARSNIHTLRVDQACPTVYFVYKLEQPIVVAYRHRPLLY